MQRNTSKVFLCWWGNGEFKIQPIEVWAFTKTEARQIYANQMGYKFYKISARFVREVC